MSMIENLIKKAFGTSNANEAASFLASACNRMKAMDKTAIHNEVSAALKGVNFSRAGESSAQAETKTKTVYRDTPDTVAKLRRVEAEAERLRRELSSAEDKRIRGLAELRAEMMRQFGNSSELLEICKQLRDQNQDLLNSNKRLIETGEEMSATNSSLLEEVESLLELKNSYKELNSSLLDCMEEKEAELTDLKGELSSMRIKWQAEQEEGLGLCKQLDERDAQIAAHAAQSKEYQRIIEVKNAAIDGFRQGFADQNAEIAKLKKQFEDKKILQQNTLKAAEFFEKAFDEISAENAAISAKNDATTAANIELARENAELKAQLERMKQSGVTGAIFRAFGV